MGWDPSMATTICRVCGKSHEAWCGDLCDDCVVEVIGNAEGKMGLSGVFQDGWLEAYTKHPDKMILKYSHGIGNENTLAANKMREFMDKNNIPYENDPECTINRTIWIKEKDYIALFEEELRKEV